MPRTMTQSQIMQPTGDFHHDVAHAISPVAQFLLDDATALHAAHRVLDPHLFACNAVILCFLLRCQLTTTRFLGWLLDRHMLNREPLKPHVLIQHTSGRQSIRFVIHNRFLVPLSGIRSTQKANMAITIDQQNVFNRVTFLLSTIVLILLVSIYRALDGTFRAIMIKKGVVSSGELSFSATSVARREGMVSSFRSA